MCPQPSQPASSRGCLSGKGRSGLAARCVQHHRYRPSLTGRLAPHASCPHAQVDGKQLAQSSAIERYAAKLAGLMPEDP